ncbi:MAG: murein L,D-transpeptidase [Gemmatimonadales bacterium]|nr:MAG: murein L,D-transpeptidase [Gemmatimonadales bacterium]
MGRSLTVLFAAFLTVGPLAAQDSPIRDLLVAERHPDLRWPDIRDVAPGLTRLYAARDWAPLWFDGDVPTPSARAMVKVLGEAGVRGLDPEDYQATSLRAELNRRHDPGPFIRDRADLALSVAAARFALALRRGRVSPETVHATYKLPVEPFDPAATVDSLARSSEPNDILRRLEPSVLHYWLLIAALVRYQQLARDSADYILPPLPRRLEPGQVYAGASTLRRLLRLLRDDRDSTLPPSPDSVYAGALVEAVRRFQIRHGLTPDGVIGDSTRVRLERPFDARIRQIELTLERSRWMPRHYSAPPLVVNVPAFQLYAFTGTQSTEASLLSMNVVVGRAFKSETPLFAANMEYLVFSPAWDVPSAIAETEIKPDALKDPEYLARNRYELVRNGDVVPPWPENIAAINDGIRVRQTPGPHNALGEVKFVLPNDFQVYLHDTPTKALFDQSRRDASHGCIRVGDPMALARFLLRDQPEWTEEKIREVMNGGEPVRVNLRTPVPVFIVYATAIARENGDVYFYPDLYGHDAALQRALAEGYPYR